MNFWESFSEEKKAGIKRAIEVAEMNTSGEIRVHLEDKCKKDVFDRAVDIFQKLEMHKTQLRNGVLFYVAVRDHKFVIIGDVGINNKVPSHFWDGIKETMLLYFKADKITEGLMEGIRLTGEQLKNLFPYQSNDVDELPNDISYGDTDVDDEN
jgi:uncharacterized membrane protein